MGAESTRAPQPPVHGSGDLVDFADPERAGSDEERGSREDDDKDEAQALRPEALHRPVRQQEMRTRPRREQQHGGGERHLREQRQHRARFEPSQVGAHERVQNEEVGGGYAGGGERESPMTPVEPHRQRPVESQVEAHREEAHQHRRAAPLESIEGVHENLQRRVTAQADGVEAQRSAGSCTTSCSVPPTSVPIARPRSARAPKWGSSQYPSSTPETIDPRLKKLEAIAGMPNTLRAFNMPMTSAASDTSRMNGYMMRVRVTVSAALPGSKPGASAATSQGAVAIPVTVMALNETAVSVA